MAGARALTDKEIKLALAQCNTRRHSARDRTLVQFSVLAGLRACELAALTVGDVYDQQGTARNSALLQVRQTKGHSARRVYINTELQRVLKGYWPHMADTAQAAPLFATRFGTAFSANTMSQLFLRYITAVACMDAVHTVGARPSSHAWQTRVLLCTCWQPWLGTSTSAPRNATSPSTKHCSHAP